MNRRIIVTDVDMERLHRLVEQYTFGPKAQQIDLLDAELGRAEVVPAHAVPPDVVTMNSRVVFEDEAGVERIVQLCWPHEAASDPSRVSVLAPVGMALLGLSAGESIDFPMPGGRMKRLRVVRVLSQPEADHRPPEPPRAA